MTVPDLHIAVLQMDIAWQSPQHNMQCVAQWLARHHDADVCLLPEMWTTGFVVDPAGQADATGEALRCMQAWAAQYRMALCGTVATQLPAESNEAKPPRYVNRMYFVTPQGDVNIYDKRHLFSMGGENRHYTAGSQRVVATCCGMRFLLLTCYDLRFPVWIRNRGDYDALLIAANWPQARRRVWDVLLQARALENQCYVVAANRVGDDPTAHYNGGSCIIDPKGKMLAAADDDMQQCIAATLSRERQSAFTDKFNTLADADSFNIIS